MPPVTFEVRGPLPVVREEGSNGVGSYSIVEGVTAGATRDHTLKAQGCYVYALERRWQGRLRYRPIYVGKTASAFDKEIFQKHKAELLDEALRSGTGRKRPGRLVVFLIVASRRKGPMPKATITKLETYLIQECYVINPKLSNTYKTVAPRPWIVRGVTDSKRGRPPRAAQRFRSMWN